MGAYSICSGLVGVSHTDRAGKKLIYRIARSGEFLFAQDSWSEVHFTSARTIADSQLLYWSNGDLELLCGGRESSAWQLIAGQAQEIQSLQESLATMAYGGIQVQMASVLVKMVDHSRSRDSTEICLTHLTSANLAHMTGCSRQAATETLNYFETKRFVRKSAGLIVLTDVAALQKIAKGSL